MPSPVLGRLAGDHSNPLGAGCATGGSLRVFAKAPVLSQSSTLSLSLQKVSWPDAPMPQDPMRQRSCPSTLKRRDFESIQQTAGLSPSRRFNTPAPLLPRVEVFQILLGPFLGGFEEKIDSGDFLWLH